MMEKDYLQQRIVECFLSELLIQNAKLVIKDEIWAATDGTGGVRRMPIGIRLADKKFIPWDQIDFVPDHSRRLF